MKFKCIVCDPPWLYQNKKTGGSMVSGADEKYNTLSLDELCNLPVRHIADKNSVLFLWATTPLLPEALKVMEAWEYDYKTAIYWRKIMSLGMGFWFRGQVEPCLMGVRGKVKAFRTQLPNVIQSKVRKHSQKPEELFTMIEPSLDKFNLNPRLEMFAREKRKDWISIGNEISGNDIRIDMLNLMTDNILDCYRSG